LVSNTTNSIGAVLTCPFKSSSVNGKGIVLAVCVKLNVTDFEEVLLGSWVVFKVVDSAGAFSASTNESRMTSSVIAS